MKRKLTHTLVLMLASICVASGGDYAVAVKLELTATGINRYLQHQYNEAGFPRLVNGTVDDVFYTLSLTAPTIVLDNGSMKIDMMVDVSSSAGPFRASFKPTIKINNGDISASELRAQYDNLASTINALQVPSWLKTALTNAYGPLTWLIYPSKLIEQVNSAWLSERSVRITDLTLTHAINPSKLELSLIANMKASTRYVSAFIGNFEIDDFLALRIPLQATVKEVLIQDNEHTLFNGVLNQTTYKEGETWLNLGPIGVQNMTDKIYAVYIRFETSNGWFSRQFELWGGHLDELGDFQFSGQMSALN